MPALDTTALNSLFRLLEECRHNGVKLLFSHVPPQPLAVMKKSGLYDMVGEENFCDNIDDALQLAETMQ